MKCDELKEKIQITNDTRMVYIKDEVDAAIAELKAKLEDVQASAYAESVDAGMRERRLKRALWLARAYAAYMNKLYINADWYSGCEKDFDFWTNTEKYCRAKAEEETKQ